MIRAIPDADGWVQTLIAQETWPGAPPATLPGEVVLEREPPVPVPLLRVGIAGSLSTPHDDRIAWRRLRKAGHDGPEATALARRRELGGLPDTAAAVSSAPGQGLTHDYADVPGLRLRPLMADDLDLMAPGAVEAGTQAATCPGDPPCCRPASAHAWLQLAERIDRDDTWQLTLEYEGTPLQMELILVEGDQALFSYTAHFNRERPHWFWREAERPVFEDLKARGVTRVVSRTRADRPDWIQSLKDNYGATEDGAWDASTIRLRFDTDAALSRMAGWPARRTAPGWSFAAGGLSVREATPEDFDTLADRIRGLWAGQARGVLTLKMLREWYRLDRATLLLGFNGSDLRQVRAVRHRRGTTSGISTLTPLLVMPEVLAMGEAVQAWHAAVGYTKATSFTPLSQWDNPRIQAQISRLPFREVGRRQRQGGEEFVEVEFDVP